MLELKQAKVGIIFETQCNYMTYSVIIWLAAYGNVYSPWWYV